MLSVNQFAVEAVNAATPSPRTTNVYNVQYNNKGTQQPSGKNNKGKKGEGNQNKPKPTNDAEGGKKEKKKVNFSCKLCKEDHLTYQFPLMEQDQKLLKQQPAVLKDRSPQGKNATSSNPKNVEGT